MTAYVVMSDAGTCEAVRSTLKDALMVIYWRCYGQHDDDSWKEEYEVDTVEELLDYIDSKRSFEGLYVQECEDCEL